MKTQNQTKGEAAPSVSLVVTRYGNFGDRLAMAAVVDGIAPGRARSILAVVYRGRSVAWVDVPVAADHAVIESAILARADYFLGSRCPDMANYPLTFEW